MKHQYVPLDKRSKKKQKEFHSKQRKSWGEFSPITRKTTNHKLYNRKKPEGWYEHEPSFGFFNVYFYTHLPLVKTYIGWYSMI